MTTRRGASGTHPIAVAAIADEYAWIAANATCGCGGEQRLVAQSMRRARPGFVLDRLELVCPTCGDLRDVFFEIDTASAAYQAELSAAAEENHLLDDDDA